MLYNPKTQGRDSYEITKINRRNEEFKKGAWFHYELKMTAEGGGKKIVHKTDKIFVSDVPIPKGLKNYNEEWKEFVSKCQMANFKGKEMYKPTFNSLLTKAKAKVKIKFIKNKKK